MSKRKRRKGPRIDRAVSRLVTGTFMALSAVVELVLAIGLLVALIVVKVGTLLVLAFVVPPVWAARQAGRLVGSVLPASRPFLAACAVAAVVTPVALFAFCLPRWAVGFAALAVGFLILALLRSRRDEPVGKPVMSQAVSDFA